MSFGKRAFDTGWRKSASCPQSNEQLQTRMNMEHQFVFFCYYWRSKQSQKHGRESPVSAGKWEEVRAASLAGQGTTRRLLHLKQGDPAWEALLFPSIPSERSPRESQLHPGAAGPWPHLQPLHHPQWPDHHSAPTETNLLHKTSQCSKYFWLAFQRGKSVWSVSIRGTMALLLIWWHSLS